MRDFTRRAHSIRCIHTLAILAAAAVATPVRAELVTAQWKTAATGNWSDGVRWTTDPMYPDNDSPPGVTYRAVIDATGVSYSVDVTGDILVDDAIINSSSAAVRHSGGTFRAVNGIDLQRGGWRVSDGGIVDSDFRVGPGAGLVFENSPSYQRTISLDGDAMLSFAPDQVFSGSAEVSFNRTGEDRKRNFVRGSNLVIGADVSMRTASGDAEIGTTTNGLTSHGLISASGDSYIRVIGNSLTNHGMLEAIDGGRLFVDLLGGSSNAGTIRATAGSSIEFTRNGGTWTNMGTFHLSDSTLVLAGYGVSPAMTAGLTRDGNAAVIVGGRVENAGATLALDAFGGPWLLGRANAGTGDIRGGNLGSAGDTGTLPVVGYSQLTDVTNHVHIDVQPGVTFTLAGNTTNSGSITASGAEIIVTGNPTSLGTMALSDSTLLFGSTYTGPGPVTNVATAQLYEIAMTQSRFLVAKGAVIDGGGNAIQVTADRSWQFAGGTLKDVSVEIDPGGKFMPVQESSTLDNVTVAGQLILDNGGLVFQNGATWIGDHITVRASTPTTSRGPGVLFAGSLTWDAPVEVMFEGASARAFVGASDTLTLASDLIVRNETGILQNLQVGGEGGSLVNRGKITVEGGRVQLRGTSVTNEGLIEVRGSDSFLVATRKPTNYANRTLTGGRWHVHDGGGLFITDYDFITTNAAEILLSGVPSDQFDAALRAVNRNEGSLTILNGHVLNVGKLTNVGEIKVGRGSVLTTNGALDSTAGTVDVDGMVIVTATAETSAAVLASVVEQISTARNSAEGPWKGMGITSAAAAADPLTGLAAFINDDGGGAPIIGTTYRAVTPDANDVVVLHTYNGDANFDGVINFDDYFRIDSAYLEQPANPTYAQGDFNYDGSINFDDYFLIDSAFLGQGAPIGAGALGAVPEPSLGCMALVAGALLRRRRGG